MKNKPQVIRYPDGTRREVYPGSPDYVQPRAWWTHIHPLAVGALLFLVTVLVTRAIVGA